MIRQKSVSEIWTPDEWQSYATGNIVQNATAGQTFPCRDYWRMNKPLKRIKLFKSAKIYSVMFQPKASSNVYLIKEVL